MDLRSIYLANGIGIFILLLLYYTSRTRLGIRHTEERIYTSMLFGLVAACFLESFSYSIDGIVFPGARVLNYIANTYLFTANVILPLFVLFYIDLDLYGDRKSLIRKYKAQICVVVFMIAMNLVNFIVPVIYYISPDNVYERRPFSYVYYIVILWICLSSVVLTRRYEKENGPIAFFNIGVFLAPVLIGAALQFMFYGLSLAWLSSAIGLTGLHMMKQNETAYIDPLVDIYNRRYMNYVIDSWIDRKYRFAGAMLDIDRFKSINDEFGHSEGDKALMKTAELLKAAKTENEFLFRFAGDEFIVVRRTDSPDGLSSFLKRFTEELEGFNSGEDRRYRLGISCGTGFFEPGLTTIDSFMKELDDNMYEMKTLHHSGD